MMRRGYTCVALENPTDRANIGHTFRAAMCFGVRFVILGGIDRDRKLSRLATDTQRAWRHIPVLEVDSVFHAIPFDCTTVAVEMTDAAIDLVDFIHPERACYIFGPENGSLSTETIERCERSVRIPTNLSLSLGASVNVILYDRLAKTRRFSQTDT